MMHELTESSLSRSYTRKKNHSKGKRTVRVIKAYGFDDIGSIDMRSIMKAKEFCNINSRPTQFEAVILCICSAGYEYQVASRGASIGQMEDLEGLISQYLDNLVQMVGDLELSQNETDALIKTINDVKQFPYNFNAKKHIKPLCEMRISEPDNSVKKRTNIVRKVSSTVENPSQPEPQEPEEPPMSQSDCRDDITEKLKKRKRFGMGAIILIDPVLAGAYGARKAHGSFMRGIKRSDLSQGAKDAILVTGAALAITNPAASFGFFTSLVVGEGVKRVVER